MKSGSSSDDSRVNTMGIRGFPKQCECGRAAVMYTSKSKSNPGRPFFRCPTQHNDHLFKWVEEGVYEEVQDALAKVEFFESEICKTKVEIDGMRTLNLELVEEIMKVKTEMRRLNLFMNVGFGSLCLFIVICIVLIMMFTRSNGFNLSSF